uniref:Leucine zipper protein 2 n=1 Tax=Leptobrachium leishanense TaxID=445787 RepID=A0A8C5MK80_9ANUR
MPPTSVTLYSASQSLHNAKIPKGKPRPDTNPKKVKNTSFHKRQGYEDLEKQLKEVFMERSSILRQLSKNSRDVEGIKGNIQSLKNNEASTKGDMQKLLEIEEKQRKEMKSLQEAFTKQLNEATEKAEKQQATINFLKTEMERKSKMIRDLQNENKSLKNKLLSGNKLCGLRAEESKRIQAQLKELRYGKKDLVARAQLLTDLEQKLLLAKDDMEKASLDKESQLKALKETVQLCLSSVLHNQPPIMNIIPSKMKDRPTSLSPNAPGVPFQTTNTESRRSVLSNTSSSLNEATMKGYQHPKNCDSHNAGEVCRLHRNSTLINSQVELEPNIQVRTIPTFNTSKRYIFYKVFWSCCLHCRVHFQNCISNFTPLLPSDFSKNAPSGTIVFWKIIFK